MRNKFHRIPAFVFLLLSVNQVLLAQNVLYKIPEESFPHEGTWLAWPHDSTYCTGYRSFFEPAWVEMTRVLIQGERIHIIAYSADEQAHIETTLINEGIELDSIDFLILPTDDYWIRDNGPLYVLDPSGQLLITDWGFDGWGGDTPYLLDDVVPTAVAGATGMPVLNLNDVVLEGGALMSDGKGTLLATRSSILGDNRNDGFTEEELEDYLSSYLGFTNIIWLDGKELGNFDITDMHIDGFATFADSSTMVTMDSLDLRYWLVSPSDIHTLYTATNTAGLSYDRVFLPLTKKNVKTTDGQNTHSKGSYVNYYVANAAVLVPVYEDEHDELALSVISGLYPDKQVVGIDCRNMFSWGGMVHCVTQQQPVMPCMLPQAGVTAEGPTTFCKGEAVALTTAFNNDWTYQWHKDGSPISGATGSSYAVTESGDFTVRVTSGCGATVSTPVACTRNARPDASIIPSGTVIVCEGDSVVLSANTGNGLTYQWKKNSVNIAGATNPTFAAYEGSNYKVEVTNQVTSCSKKSKATKVEVTCRALEETGITPPFSIDPNPASTHCCIGWNGDSEELIELQIINAVGQVMIPFLKSTASEFYLNGISLESFPSGTYFVQIISEQGKQSTCKLGVSR